MRRPGVAKFRPVYVPVVIICPARIPVLVRSSFTRSTAGFNGSPAVWPPVVLHDHLVAEREAHRDVDQVERAPIRSIGADDVRAVRHAVGGALDQRRALVVAIAGGDDLDGRKRDDAVGNLFVRIGVAARRRIAEETKADLRLHAQQRHVARLDRAAASHDAGGEQHAVAEPAFDHAADFPSRDALAQLRDGRGLDAQRFVQRRRTAVLGQSLERSTRAACRNQQRCGLGDRFVVHGDCSGRTRIGVPSRYASAFSAHCA